MSTLAGKVAVISGGTTGIGLATARRFAAEGAHVFIFGRRKAPLDEATQLIGGSVTAIQADAANLDDLDRVAAAVRAEKGVVDIVVSNAGFTEQASIDTLTPEHFDMAFNLMARGPVFLVQKLLPLMTRGGSIILVSSGMHVMGIPGHTAYAATKAALRSYARTWAAEFKDRGIRVNTLSPGVTDTPILDSQGGVPRGAVEAVPGHDPDRPTRSGRGDRERGAVPGVRPELLRDRCGSHGRRWRRPSLSRAR